MLASGKPRIAIIGGGISGVTAAYELARRHPEASFTLFEASSRLGGIVETVHEGSFTIECGPDSWVTEKPWARELAEELGLADEIIPSNDVQRRTYIARGRELLPMPDGMRMMVPTRWEPLLHSPLLSWQARLAYLREPKRADELKQTSLAHRGAHADESVSEFVLRHFGEEVAKHPRRPLPSRVFGGDIEKLSVRAVMAPFVRCEVEYGSLIEALRLRALAISKGCAATFTSLRSGLGTLIESMVDRLTPSSITLNTKVSDLQRAGNAWGSFNPDPRATAFRRGPARDAGACDTQTPAIHPKRGRGDCGNSSANRCVFLRSGRAWVRSGESLAAPHSARIRIPGSCQWTDL